MTPNEDAPVVRIEIAISNLLRIGVTVSLGLVIAGTVLSFIQAGGYGTTPSELQRLIGPGGAFPRTPTWLLAGLRHPNGQAVIVLGLLLLIATPVFRVAISVFGYAREKDRAYVIITAIVLSLLLLSFALGKAG